MSVTTAVRPFTYDTLLDMPDDGNKYEIIGGKLFVTAAPAEPHQWASIRLVSGLHVHADANDLGQVYHAPVDVRLGPHDIVQPDIIFIRRDRRHLYQGSIFEGPPDLVIEIFSPSTRKRDETIKLALYARSGVREYWMVDTEARSITSFVLSDDGGYQQVAPDGGIIRSTVVPGFEVDVKAFFAMMV